MTRADGNSENRATWESSHRRVCARAVEEARRIPALHVILVVALVVRAAAAFAALSQHATHAPDTMTYLRPAASLVASARFDSYGAPELSRTPGYPLLLAVGELAGNVIPVTLALQVILNTTTVFGVAVLALAMGGSARVAVLAAALYALDASSVIYVSKILTETLFTAVVVALLIALACWVRSGAPRYLVASGLLAAAGCYVRPILYYAPPLLAVVIGAVAWRRYALGWRALAHAALFFVVAGVPIAAWRVRNTAVAGYDRFAAITDINLLVYRADGVIARRSAEPIELVQARLRSEWGSDSTFTAFDRTTRGRERATRYYGMRAEARAILINDAPAVALDAVAGAARTLFGRDTSNWALLFNWQPGSLSWQILKSVLAALWLPVFALGLVGVVRGGWGLYVMLPALVTSAYLVATSAGPEAYSRFRLAIVPLITVLAASGALWVWERWREPRHVSPARPHTYENGP